MMTLAIVLAVVVIAAISLRLAVPSLSSTSVATGIVNSNGGASLGDCPDTPNCAGSQSSRSAQQVDSFTVTLPAEDIINNVAIIINAQAGTEIVTQDERYLHATFKTQIMGYIDDVEFLLGEDGQSLQVRSASRLGKSDLGANAKRIAMLRELAAGNI